MRFVREKIRGLSVKADLGQAERGPLETQNFVEKMILARDKDPEKVTDYHIFMMGLSNVIAGSDTTAISLSAIMYNLLRCPEAMEKLRREIDEFTAQGSATGLPLWRVVPDGGAEINGYFFPAGTVVGVNTWVAHYDEEVFPDATTFRPERWIEAESNPEKLKAMNEMYMPFGLGTRTCLGKHISILEMSKLIPRIVRDFDFSTGRANWETENRWFVKPTNFTVRVTQRLAARS
ncbi:hypothetical protein Aspvir_004388 [Aspergillus viridinutans]|uniref:Cytochrome P450 n=1 Tax=Aspergillus viridinutans TaxID=75553 RepID=A0A9P3BPI8_ASPVI|nr:uncharacterized protein Aspvir_004388 [Aspergillus viridinutans]GIK00365.1 hypothetical protein Aspvir_004388 [Aspergillus viridinutans]